MQIFPWLLEMYSFTGTLFFHVLYCIWQTAFHELTYLYFLTKTWITTSYFPLSNQTLNNHVLFHSQGKYSIAAITICYTVNYRLYTSQAHFWKKPFKWNIIHSIQCRRYLILETRRKQTKFPLAVIVIVVVLGRVTKMFRNCFAKWYGWYGSAFSKLGE